MSHHATAQRKGETIEVRCACGAWLRLYLHHPKKTFNRLCPAVDLAFRRYW